MAVISLTKDQQRAITAVKTWLNTTAQEFSIGGLAGTGKTTIIGALRTAEFLQDWDVTFLAPTGKAAQMMRSKGLPAETIHSYMYRFTGWAFNEQTGVHDPLFAWREPDCEASMIVIDEASMVDGRIADELRELGKRILWVGDHGQLPPIGRDPGIMAHPKIRLEKIHRQLAGSPILSIAYAVRAGEQPKQYMDDELEVAWISGTSPNQLAAALIDEEYDQVIVATHRVRVAVNKAWRDEIGLGLDDSLLPEAGDRLVCLKNNRSEGLMNGMTFTVEKIVSSSSSRVTAKLVDGASGAKFPLITMWRQAFGNIRPDLKDLPSGLNAFDFGYAITCHKAQGSEWDNVAVLESGAPRNWDMRRWRYTAYTRAARRLCVLMGRLV